MDHDEPHRRQTDDSMEGIWILGQYRIVRALARGGMGRVYLADQVAMERQAAIKIVRPTGDGSMDDLRRRFRQEARTASRLVHPHIVTVYNFGELADGSLFLAMEFVEGAGLGAILERGPLPLDQALEVARQCAQALGHAHEKGVIHRDFKPDNVMLTEWMEQDHVKILDFGVARIVGDATLTQVGALLGTPRYMSPEQCRGEVATALSDQYALGLTIYEMLTGQPAVVADSPIGFLHCHQHQPPRPPSAAAGAPELAPLDPVVLRMLSKEPDARFVDVAQALEVLEQAAAQIERPADGLRRTGPLCQLSEPEGAQNGADSGGLPIVLTATAVEASERRPALVWSLGEREAMTAQSREKLRRRGFHVTRRESAEPLDPGGAQQDDLWVLGCEPGDWAEVGRAWLQRGVSSSRSLLCVDSALETDLLGGVEDLFENVLIGAWPLEPTVLTAALQWLRQRETGGIEGLLSDRSVQVIQIVSSGRKSAYVESLLEDARAEGFRRSVLRSLGELAEEMILNAIFHAPIDHQGTRRYAHLERSDEVSLRPGEEPTLRWLILKRFIAVSIRDPFGSLPAGEVLSRIIGARPQLEFDRASVGAGMGLRIMSRAAKHLVIAICPGSWTEVLALVPRGADERSSGGRSVCVLRGSDQRSHAIGDRLRLFVIQREDETLLELKGEINETSHLHQVFGGRGAVRLDLSQVNRVNSVGLRAWVEALRARPADQRLTFERCSMAVVSQLNMIPAFSEGAQVESIMAPYHCAVCDAEAMELLTLEELRGVVPPPRRCARCGRDLEFDDLPEEYFAFLEAERRTSA